MGVRCGRREAWSPGQNFWAEKELKVHLAPLPNDCRPPNSEFTKHTVIDWANRWRNSENSPVPKFIETATAEEADIRVKFVGEEKMHAT